MQFWASFYEELQAGRILINLYDPKPQHSSTPPRRLRRLLSSARWLLHLRGCARSDCNSALAARVSSREPPGRGAEHTGHSFSFQTFGFWVMFLSLKVIEVHQMLLLVPWTLLWSTGEPLQRLSSTQRGFSWGRCPIKVGPSTWGTLPTKALTN